MSGGELCEYQQFVLDDISQTMEKNQEHNFQYITNERIRTDYIESIEKLKRLAIYLQRIDWVLSGDDGTEAYHKRLKEELEKV